MLPLLRRAKGALPFFLDLGPLGRHADALAIEPALAKVAKDPEFAVPTKEKEEEGGYEVEGGQGGVSGNASGQA